MQVALRLLVLNVMIHVELTANYEVVLVDGAQGSQFFVSLEDNLMRLFGSEEWPRLWIEWD